MSRWGTSVLYIEGVLILIGEKDEKTHEEAVRSIKCVKPI